MGAVRRMCVCFFWRRADDDGRRRTEHRDAATACLLGWVVSRRAHSIVLNSFCLVTMKFTAAASLALFASASAFAPAPTASVSEE